MKVRKTNDKGFTLVEVIVVVALLVVIAGLFAVNMINTLNKNKDEGNKGVISEITSAADAYVAANPEEVEKLYNGFGYVDIEIGELRDAGFLSEKIKDAETGKVIPDEEIVRVKLDLGDYLDFTYPVDPEEKDIKAWTMVAEPLTIEYDKSTDSATWCANNQNKFSGLYDANYVNMKNYAEVTSKLYVMDNSADKSGEMYGKEGANQDYFRDLKLQAEECNVNPQKAGTYNITYKYLDPDLKTEKTYNRPVYVKTSTSDVISFTAVINDGKPIMLGAKDVPITITETYKDGTTGILESTTDSLNAIEYEIEKFDTSVVGSRNAVVTTSKTNSDGSKPEAQQPPYKVTDSFIEILAGSPDCTTSTTSGTKCYYRGEQEGNYVDYYGKIFRIYVIDKETNTMGIIYDQDYVVEPYGQLGGCFSGCCNNGRYAYISLGDYNRGFSKTMDTHLNSFYNSLNRGSSLRYLQSQTFTSFYNEEDYSLRTNHNYANQLSVYGHITNLAVKTKTMTTKVALLQASDYSEIANCSSQQKCITDTICSDSTSSRNNCFTGTFCTPEYTCKDTTNYLNKGTDFWLLDFYSVRLGVGAYNGGVNAAEAQEFKVTASGDVSHDGATKAQGSQTPIINRNGVRPTVSLNNPKILSGDGTKDAPYVVSVN